MYSDRRRRLGPYGRMWVPLSDRIAGVGGAVLGGLAGTEPLWTHHYLLAQWRAALWLNYSHGLMMGGGVLLLMTIVGLVTATLQGQDPGDALSSARFLLWGTFGLGSGVGWVITGVVLRIAVHIGWPHVLADLTTFVLGNWLLAALGYGLLTALFTQTLAWGLRARRH